MQRTFTANVGRFKQGETRDYPKDVWDRIALSAKQKLDKFTTNSEPVRANARGQVAGNKGGIAHANS